MAVVADDTDVYVLLLYYYQAECLKVPMKLQSTQSGRDVIDIANTVKNLQSIISELLPAHALTGCDTVSMCHGIGKAKMLKTVQGGKCSLTMTEARIKSWLDKTGWKSASKVPSCILYLPL